MKPSKSPSLSPARASTLKTLSTLNPPGRPSRRHDPRRTQKLAVIAALMAVNSAVIYYYTRADTEPRPNSKSGSRFSSRNLDNISANDTDLDSNVTASSPNPQSNSRSSSEQLTGEQWINELLSNSNSTDTTNTNTNNANSDGSLLISALGVSRTHFLHLEHLLIRKSNLRPTRHLDTREQLGIFLATLETGASIRKMAERFKRSTETVNRTYHKVMKCFLVKEFYDSVVDLELDLDREPRELHQDQNQELTNMDTNMGTHSTRQVAVRENPKWAAFYKKHLENDNDAHSTRLSMAIPGWMHAF